VFGGACAITADRVTFPDAFAAATPPYNTATVTGSEYGEDLNMDSGAVMEHKPFGRLNEKIVEHGAETLPTVTVTDTPDNRQEVRFRASRTW